VSSAKEEISGILFCFTDFVLYFAIFYGTTECKIFLFLTCDFVLISCPRMQVFYLLASLPKGN